MSKKRIIVGISGASGVIYGIRLLKLLQSTDIETHLIMSNSAEITLAYESDLKVADVKNLADVAHNVKDIAACLSSGSYRTLGMVIAPCSVRTMSEISSGVTSSLLTRSADVILKERRKLVLMVRETPLHTGHLRTMTSLSELGAIIAPPVPAFYARPENLDEMVDYSLGRILDLFDIELPGMNRWDENSKKRPAS
ncbi:UbiX family flavin prenyltransferase [Kiloniella majae]|uniref:UbiX family flavin prenyltransferase n=1 Tax=Kiloniella majae TaxID=1938558 RepID=UPI000A276EFB|nr:UbiX family flavin prenyltransferase [Kiloniella majae]